jgi:uncharacterized protein YrrD
MMRFTECLHRNVVATSTASTIGRVDGFVVRPAPSRVVALRLGKTETKGMLLDWAQLTAFGPDAVTVPSVEQLRQPADQAEREATDESLDLLGKRALSESGDGLGTVTDVEFDPDTGAVRTVLTDRQAVPGDRLIGLGGYAAVFAVADPAIRSTQTTS